MLVGIVKKTSTRCFTNIKKFKNFIKIMLIKSHKKAVLFFSFRSLKFSTLASFYNNSGQVLQKLP